MPADNRFIDIIFRNDEMTKGVFGQGKTDREDPVDML